ncbi:HD domain-containing protein [Methylomonas sp. LL1]|uniref:HD-GYP domain-containing protein n=1 Tax=Methylomonas sp. LL1 TaxID=2785785 RepID=UPI0018C3638D|nr:HD domain-containing phosphohydrolase [Methylomonas sp. LL1]QPK63580.1 HD domain-containing protein [Methylomonas sp. LL1]
MQSRTRSIRKILIFRLLALAVLLSVLVGGSVLIRERITLQEDIADRTRIAIELLKLRVRDIATLSHQPWQTTVQEALDDLSRVAPQNNLGHFAWAAIQNADGQEIARIADADSPNIQGLIDAAKSQALPVDADPAITPLAKYDGRYSFSIGLLITDHGGQPLANLRGVYIIASDVMSEFWRDILRSVGASILIVILVTALHYPVIRQLLERLGQLSIHLLDANLETLQGFGSAIAKRDSDTDEHNYRVTIYSVKLAEAVGLEPDRIRTLIKGAFLHDVGKIGIRDHILLKPGRLDTDEFEIMQTHVRHGLDIVNNCHWLQDASEVVGNHHEKFDGSGYDLGLKGEQIPITARIFAIVDVFDALTSQRPYKSPLSLQESLAILRSGAGKHFDPALLEVFDGIAGSLYHSFAHHEQQSRSELSLVIQHYFKGDIGDLLQGSLV